MKSSRNWDLTIADKFIEKAGGYVGDLRGSIDNQGFGFLGKFVAEIFGRISGFSSRMSRHGFRDKWLSPFPFDLVSCCGRMLHLVETELKS